jgi:hypothetical protein
MFRTAYFRKWTAKSQTSGGLSIATVFTAAVVTLLSIAGGISTTPPADAAGYTAKKPTCTKSILWYTSDGEVCAPTKVAGQFKWQTSIKRSDTTSFMKTCRNFFSAKAGGLLCDWVQKYVNNIITFKAPRDNCLTFLKGLLNNAAYIAQTNKSATLGTAITPYATKNSWICHP